MLITPKYNLKQFNNVYEPSEDSFVFLDAIEEELIFLQNLKPTRVVEIGSGSGVLITALAKVLQNCSFYSTDINITACKATLNTAALNDCIVESCCMNLLTNFKPNLFDVVLFNPPYVVTDPRELSGNGLNRAWAGGENGREIINELLPNVGDILSDSGVLYLLLIRENNPEEIVEILKKLGFSHRIVRERKILGEYLYVIKFFRSKL